MRMNRLLTLSIALALITGCADTLTFTEAQSTVSVGFWYGIWHGLILPISWICSLFSDDIAIYAIYNSGGWYDFGFFLGVGGLSASATSR